MTDPVDAAAVVQELRAEVERRRAAGEYDEHALKALHEEFGADFNEPPEAVAYIAASRPLASDRPGIGPITVFTKRVVRRLLAWYVAPIADDQTRYNIASIRLLRHLEQRLVALEQRLSGDSHPAIVAPSERGELAEIRSRLDRLEQRLDELAGASRRSSDG